MKVLLVSTEYLPYHGGVAEVVHGLAQTLPQHGIEVTVLIPRMPGRRKSVAVPYPVKRYACWGLRHRKWQILWTATAIMRHAHRFDVTLALDLISHRALSILPPSAKFLRRCGLYFYGSEVLEHAVVGAVGRRKRLIASCPRLFAISKYAAGLVERFFLRRDVAVVYPGIREEVLQARRDHARVSELRRMVGERPLVVTLGRLDPRKGQDTVVQVAAVLRSRGLEPAFVLIGTGPLREQLARRVQELGLGRTVSLLGSVSEEEKIAWLDSCDVVLQPSRRHGYGVEGLGLAMAEAGARGRSVISSQHGGIPEVIRHNRTGILVPEEATPELWARHVETLLRENSLRNRLGEAARHYVAHTFRWGLAAKRFSELLTNALAKGHKKP